MTLCNVNLLRNDLDVKYRPQVFVSVKAKAKIVMLKNVLLSNTLQKVKLLGSAVEWRGQAPLSAK